MLYLSTSLPIIPTDIPFGILLDRVPIYCTILFVTVSSVCSTFAFSLLLQFRPQGFKIMMYVCRAVFGMAGSSAFTIQGFITSKYAAKYY